MDAYELNGLMTALGPGRKSKEVAIGAVRELTVEDMLKGQVAGEERGAGVVPTVKVLRQSHHQLAQLLASGAKNEEAAIITGYSSSRISVLKADPGFQELLAFYTQQEQNAQDELRASILDRMKNLGLDTIEELQRRLDEQPEGFTNLELMKQMELVSDRTGHGKTTTIQTNTEHSLTPETLARLRELGGRTEGVSIREEDRSALLGLAAPIEADFHPVETERAEGGEGPGDQLREAD